MLFIKLSCNLNSEKYIENFIDMLLNENIIVDFEKLNQDTLNNTKNLLTKYRTKLSAVFDNLDNFKLGKEKAYNYITGVISDAVEYENPWITLVTLPINIKYIPGYFLKDGLIYITDYITGQTKEIAEENLNFSRFQTLITILLYYNKHNKNQTQNDFLEKYIKIIINNLVKTMVIDENFYNKIYIINNFYNKKYSELSNSEKILLGSTLNPFRNSINVNDNNFNDNKIILLDIKNSIATNKISIGANKTESTMNSKLLDFLTNLFEDKTIATNKISIGANKTESTMDSKLSDFLTNLFEDKNLKFLEFTQEYHKKYSNKIPTVDFGNYLQIYLTNNDEKYIVTFNTIYMFFYEIFDNYFDNYLKNPSNISLAFIKSLIIFNDLKDQITPTKEFRQNNKYSFNNMAYIMNDAYLKAEAKNTAVKNAFIEINLNNKNKEKLKNTQYIFNKNQLNNNSNYNPLESQYKNTLKNINQLPGNKYKNLSDYYKQDNVSTEFTRVFVIAAGGTSIIVGNLYKNNLENGSNNSKDTGKE